MTDILTSRRQLIGAGAAGLGALAAGGRMAQASQACGGFTREQYQDYVDRFNADDPTFIKYYHDDVELELPAATIKGATAIRDFYKVVHAHIKETVQFTHFVSDETGIAVVLPSEFACYKDWSGGYFPRDLKAGEVMRTISFGMYWVKDGKISQIKAARYKLVNDWRQEGFKLEGQK